MFQNFTLRFTQIDCHMNYPLHLSFLNCHKPFHVLTNWHTGCHNDIKKQVIELIRKLLNI
jgi:hypothetical protein